jgi:hypothetical protein
LLRQLIYSYHATQHSLISDVRDIARPWVFVAGRDGAMSIYHFAKSMEGMMAFLGQCPTVLDKVDRTKLRSARKMLRELFPDFEAVRHAVAHAGELMKDPDTFRSTLSFDTRTFGRETCDQKWIPRTAISEHIRRQTPVLRT